MTISSPWRDLEERFRALRDAYGNGLEARWNASGWNDQGEKWYLYGSANPHELDHFKSLAERAVIELGRPAVSGTLFVWLDVLKMNSPNFWVHKSVRLPNSDGSDGRTRVGGVWRLHEASADYCLKLENKDIAAQRALTTPPPQARRPKPDKGNLDLLRGTGGQLKRAVTLDVAARFGGVSKRAIEVAAKKCKLSTEGTRQQRRALVDSLLKYFPPEK
jgi:hypothetical protein